MKNNFAGGTDWNVFRSQIIVMVKAGDNTLHEKEDEISDSLVRGNKNEEQKSSNY